MLYDEKLQRILDKYSIEVMSDAELSNNIEGIIIEALTQKCKNKTCALWGAGQNNTKSSHAAIMISRYATYIQNMVCVIDSNPELQGKNFLGYPIIAPSQMDDYHIDLVIIASKNSGASIKKNLFEVKDNCGYIDIYEELRNRGINVYNYFYDENSIYTQIYDTQAAYQQNKDENSLRQLISLYLSIRDFYYAQIYIKEYIKNRFTNYQTYEALFKDITDLLKEMKSKNENRENDVSLFYIDALRAKEVFDLQKGTSKVFKRYCNNGKALTNIYSTAVTTYESMMSVVTGRYPLDTNVYTDDYLHELKEFRLLADYAEKGYDINFMVSECYRIIKATDRINFYQQNYMTQKLWTLACRLAETRKDTFNFTYFPYEIHFPLLCGYHHNKPVIKAFSDLGIEEFPDSMAKQYDECIDYSDKQFEFYYELIGRNTWKVIFSDHSQVVYDPENNHKTYNMYYKNKELTTHVPMIVSKEGKKPAVDHKLYSMIDFNEIVKALIKETDLEPMSREIVRYQYYPMHNQKMRDHAVQYHFEDYIDGIDVFLSQEYVYAHTATGVNEVYRISDLNNNVVHTEAGRTFINMVNQIYKASF